jgi:HSP20 family protein
MDRIFDRMWGEFGLSLFPRSTRELPFLDLSEKGDNLIIEAELPGIDPEDLEISVDDDTITITGESRQDAIKSSGSYHRMERRYGSFSRTIKLPCRVMVNDVSAEYRKGILTISMPKCKAEKTRKLKVSRG